MCSSLKNSHSKSVSGTERAGARQTTEPRTRVFGRPRFRLSVVRVAAGVTLIELLVVLSVLTILMTVGVPSFVTLTHNSQASALSGELAMTFALARSEAIKRGAAVTVCASSDGATCAEDWSAGWIVTAAGDAEPLRVHQPKASYLGPVEASGQGRVVFGSLGALRTAAVSFTVCDESIANVRCRLVDLAASGRVTISTR